MVLVPSKFIALRNMTPRIEGIGSAMMKWSGDYRKIYERFLDDPERNISENNSIGTNNWGDQSFIWKVLHGDVEFFQNKFPDRIKKFNEPGGDITVFYGRKKPWSK
jgi:hypothetical protein